MKRFALILSLTVAVAFGALLGGIVQAGSANLTTPAIFDTAFQSGGLGAYLNAQTCLNSGALGGANCTTAGSGCIAVPLSQNPSTGLGLFKSCTIYTLDGPGETTFAQDQLNYAIVAAFNTFTTQKSNASFCTAWKAASGANQNIALSAISATGDLPPCQ